METKPIPQKYFLLNNGKQIPSLGCGTSTYQFGYDNISECMIEAINHGYRHIDTAHKYFNYAGLKTALAEVLKTVKREELFIVTKVEWKTEKEPKNEVKEDLQEIGLTYFDLVLIHWLNYLNKFNQNRPYGPKPIHKQWDQLEQCVELGYAHSIGVSNFNVQALNDLLTYAKIKPVCNQVEYHVYLQQDKLVKYCLSKGIYVVAFSPFCKAGLKEIDGKPINPFEEEILKKISKKYNKTISQVMLCWMLHKQIIPIPKSTKIKNIQENFDCYFAMEEEDIQSINGLNKNLRIADPSKYDFLDFTELFS